MSDAGSISSEKRREIMDSLTPEQRSGIAEIIQAAEVLGDYTGSDSDGGSFWQDSAADTLQAIASYFANYDPKSVIE